MFLQSSQINYSITVTRIYFVNNVGFVCISSAVFWIRRNLKKFHVDFRYGYGGIDLGNCSKFKNYKGKKDIGCVTVGKFKV